MKLKPSIYIVTLLASVATLVAVVTLGTPRGTTAQDCTTYTEQNTGNLLGYIVASNLPSEDDQNLIYVSSTDDPWSGGPDYGVTYDRDLGLFSGRAWNEGLSVWIDFDYGGSDDARVLDSEGNPVGGFAWGYWEGRIEGLDDLSYSTNQGGFVGQNPYDAQYTSGTSSGDVAVGLGELDFSNVVFDTAQIPSECQEYVDVYANGATSVNLPSCGDTVSLIWNSSNVVEDSCYTVDNGAPWPSYGSVNEVNTSPIDSGAITTDNAPAYFKITCTGAITDGQVTGIARVSCEEATPPGEVINFEFIES